MNNKKILFLTWKDIKHPNKGGAEKVIYEYAKGLVKKGHSVTWFGFTFRGGKEKEMTKGIEIIRKFNILNYFFLFPKYYINNFAGKYDLIIDEAGGLPFLSPILEKDTPIIFLTHHIGDKEWDYKFKFPLNYIFKKIYFFLFKIYRNKKTVTVSNSTKNELISIFGFNKKNIKVIENALDLKPIEKINFEKKKNSILFLGRLMPIKRVEDSIKAFYEFYKTNKSYELNIVGIEQDKEYVNTLKTLVKKLNIKTKVNFLGFNKRTCKKYLSLSKILLVPSYKEGFGLVVIEGNAYGLPAIGYKVAGLKDSIKNAQNGFLIKDGDYKSMGEKLKEILSKNDFYITLSQNSLKHAKKMFGWKKKVEEFENFIIN